MTEERLKCDCNNMREATACQVSQHERADDTSQPCKTCTPCIREQMGRGGTQEVTLSDVNSSSSSNPSLCTTGCANAITKQLNNASLSEKQLVNNSAGDSNKQKGNHIEGLNETINNCCVQKSRALTSIPSVVVSDTTILDEDQPLNEPYCLVDQHKDCMDSGYSTGARNPKIQNICESSGSLDSNNGDILLGEVNEHQLLSPRRSCDSAYSSSMDNGGSMDNQQDEPGISFSVVDSSDFSGANASSAEESPSHKPKITTLTVGMLRKNASSPFSSSSSIASDVDSSSRADESAFNTLSVQIENLPRKLSSSSSCSLRSSLSFEESEEDFASSDENPIQANMNRRHSKVKAQNSWTKIRRMVIWSPFMQSFKKKYPWVQLAGHAGNFQPGEEGCILKKYVEREAECLSGLTSDPKLQDFSPTFHGVVEVNGEKYTRMQDLLLPFDCPSLMDCKMGIRTYLEDELVKAKVKPRLRQDMYMKMVEVSPDEPTEVERNQSAVTKPRYMQWREQISSTSNLGFRIEGIKKSDKDPSKDYKLTKTQCQVCEAFKYFIDNNVSVLKKYIERLKSMCHALGQSDFFHSHEVIGSSLLFVHDSTGEANVWMIDFGKTTRLPSSQKLDHRSEWKEGNREDGYLFGMDNLVSLFEGILVELQQTAPPNDEPQHTAPPSVEQVNHVTDDVTWSPRSNRKALRRQDARNSATEIAVVGEKT
uniref:Kinase n=1 Tax=Phallusia mammillata TaxID=59560 RepID=A0A6F9DG33_9ASCI|nr:inositol-trisphosphate 3-kinase A-like [Phallusia mammillata]